MIKRFHDVIRLWGWIFPAFLECLLNIRWCFLLQAEAGLLESGARSFFFVWLFLNPFVESFLVFSDPLETPLHRLSCFGTCAIQVMTAIEHGKLSQLPGRHQVHCFWTDAPQESMSMWCRIRMCQMLKAGWHSTFGCGGPLLWWTPVHAFWPQLCEFDSKSKLKWSQMESLKRPGIEVIETNLFFITDHQWWSLCTPCPTSQPLMPDDHDWVPKECWLAVACLFNNVRSLSNSDLVVERKLCRVKNVSHTSLTVARCRKQCQPNPHVGLVLTVCSSSWR